MEGEWVDMVGANERVFEKNCTRRRAAKFKNAFFALHSSPSPRKDAAVTHLHCTNTQQEPKRV